MEEKKKVFRTIKDTLIQTGYNLEGYLREYPEEIMKKAFKYFELKLSITDEATKKYL